MNGALTLRFTAQAQLDIRRMTRELSDLQRQVASGAKANDLRGLGGAASQVLNASTMRAAADARASSLNQLEARFGVQAAALSQAATANQNLAGAIRDAISANDGRGVATELNLAFISATAAMNETWNGQPMFAGERQSGAPIRINSLEALETATGNQLFDEAERPQILDLGAGSPIRLADKASELSTEMYDAMRELHLMIEGMGGEVGQPIDGAVTEQLIAFAERFEAVSSSFTNAEGRAGQLQSRFTAERTRQVERSNLLLKEIGERADADIAMVSVRISSLLVQYEASAKTFGDLSKLSLLDYI
ncbi:flagellar hook-associated protein FlgL [alpha proteobacterium U9-1i]|nr:flagellar hook-associated protein FlgL [alpha proteobacterium U9-1i]